MILVYSITVRHNEEEHEYRFLNINDAHAAMLLFMQHGCDFEYMEREVHETSSAYPKIINKQPLLIQQVKEWCDRKKDIVELPEQEIKVKKPEKELTPVKKPEKELTPVKKPEKELTPVKKPEKKTSPAKKPCSYIFSRGVNKGKQCNTVCVENKVTCKLHTK